MEDRSPLHPERVDGIHLVAGVVAHERAEPTRETGVEVVSHRGSSRLRTCDDRRLDSADRATRGLHKSDEEPCAPMCAARRSQQGRRDPVAHDRDDPSCPARVGLRTGRFSSCPSLSFSCVVGGVRDPRRRRPCVTRGSTGNRRRSTTRPRHALDLDVDSPHLVQALAPNDADRVRIEVETPIGKQTIIEQPVARGSIYENPELPRRREGRAVRRRALPRAHHRGELRRDRVGPAHRTFAVHDRRRHHGLGRGRRRRARARRSASPRVAGSRRHRPRRARRRPRRRGCARAVAAVRLDRDHADRDRLVDRAPRGRGRRHRRRSRPRCPAGAAGATPAPAGLPPSGHHRHRRHRHRPPRHRARRLRPAPAPAPTPARRAGAGTAGDGARRIAGRGSAAQFVRAHGRPAGRRRRRRVPARGRARHPNRSTV